MKPELKPTCSDTKLGRLKFRRMMRMEMIDANEREIERRKSYNRNLKEQIKAINREMDVEYRKRTNAVGSYRLAEAMANVSPAIPVEETPEQYRSRTFFYGEGKAAA